MVWMVASGMAATIEPNRRDICKPQQREVTEKAGIEGITLLDAAFQTSMMAAIAFLKDGCRPKHTPPLLIMNLRPITGLSALLCIAIASCYPLEDPRIQQGNAQSQTPSNATQEQLLAQQQKEEAIRKAEEDLRRQQALLDNPANPQHSNTSTSSPSNPSSNGDYPFASKVPGKDGFVFSPYNNRVVDVRDIPTGTLVQDPTYPQTEKKYFRVP